MNDQQQKIPVHGEQCTHSQQPLQIHQIVPQQMPHYYENSGDVIRRMNLSSHDSSSNMDETSSSSKLSNYVAMNPSQFYSHSYRETINHEDDELLSQKVLPLIPFDPTHNTSLCGASRQCHEYEAIDPIR